MTFSTRLLLMLYTRRLGSPQAPAGRMAGGQARLRGNKCQTVFQFTGWLSPRSHSTQTCPPPRPPTCMSALTLAREAVPLKAITTVSLFQPNTHLVSCRQAKRVRKREGRKKKHRY